MQAFTGTRSEYDSLLADKVVEDKLFHHARELLSVKALLVDQELYEAQKSMSPGFEAELREGKKSVVVAVDLSADRGYSKSDLKFLLNGSQSVDVVELVNPVVKESHYPFAYPHYRVFFVYFDAALGDSRQLQVRSPVGFLELELKGG